MSGGSGVFYEGRFGIGLRKTFRTSIEAFSLEEAARRFEEPDGDLRDVIEDIMWAARVDPELRGWHNYEVLSVRKEGKA